MTENEFIKAIIDFIKLIISATLAAIFLLTVYNIQSNGANGFNISLAVIILSVALAIESLVYMQFAKKLLDI